MYKLCDQDRQALKAQCERLESQLVSCVKKSQQMVSLNESSSKFSLILLVFFLLDILLST